MALGRTLSHISVLSFEPAFWDLAESERLSVEDELRVALTGAADAVHLYRTFGTRAGSDALVWSSVNVEAPDAPARFFESFADSLRPFRGHVRLVDVLWGLTGESEYSRRASERAIDPFQPRSRQYFIVYPFAKTQAWYATDPEERREMMAEHIRVGLSHADIEQQLLYCTGLQDHEFVVVYETDDLAAFTALVSELRRTEARAYTLLDAPVHVGVHLWSGDRATEPA